MREIIQALREKDIFKGASPEDLAAREATRKAEIAKKIAEFKAKHKGDTTNIRIFKEGTCPVCSSTNLEYTDSDESDEELTHEFVCNDCESVSTEVYTLKYKETWLDQVQDEISGGE